MTTRDRRLLYLKQRGYSYSVRVRVPPALRAEFNGNTHLEQALRTRSLDEANLLKWDVVRDFKQRITHASRGDAWVNAAKALRDKHRAAPEDSEDRKHLFATAFTMADVIEEQAGIDRARAFIDLALSESPSLRESFAAYQEHQKKRKGIADATVDKRSRALEDFLSFKGAKDLAPASITREDAWGFVDHLTGKGRSYETIRAKVDALSAAMNHLEHEKKLPAGTNPFRGIELSKEAIGRGRAVEKRAFTDTEIIKLFGDPGFKPLWCDLYVMGFFTGMRENSICSLLVGDITAFAEGFLLSIRKDKSKAGTRTIAVCHPLIVSVLARRIANKDATAQLFTELNPRGPQGTLSHYVQKRMGEHRKRLQLTEVDFHSTRRNILTMQEAMGADYVAICRYVGHKVPTLMHSVYSKGGGIEQSLAIARAIRYPEKVEAAMRASLERV